MLSSSSVNKEFTKPWYRRSKVAIPVLILVIVVVVLSDLGRPANNSDRQGEFTTFANTVKTDMLSCNASVSDSMTVLNDIQTGKSKDLVTAKRIVNQDEPNCSVAVNSDLLDMSTMTIPSTLNAYNLSRVLKDMDTWAYPNAVRLIADVQTSLKSGLTPALTQDMKAKIKAMGVAQAEAQAILNSTAKSLSMKSAPQLKLDGLSSLPSFIRN